MAKAQLEDSAEFKKTLEEWGLSGEFKSAQLVTEEGLYEMNENVKFTVSAGTYIAVMNNGKLAMGATAEAAAQQAQYTSIDNPSIN